MGGDNLLCMNTHLTKQSELTTTVEGGAVAITWEDCGDSTTHGKVTDLQPLSFNIGEAVTLTGTGSLDEDVKGGNFKIHMEAAGLIKEDWTGDICEAKTFKLPLALGTVTWGGMTFPWQQEPCLCQLV